MIVCPKCKELAYLNTHFGAYYCSDCDWADYFLRDNRDKYQGSEYNIWFELDKHIKELYTEDI
jgi:hypothetical protein